MDVTKDYGKIIHVMKQSPKMKILLKFVPIIHFVVVDLDKMDEDGF